MNVIVVKPAPEHVIVKRETTPAIIVHALPPSSVVVVGGMRGIPGPDGPMGPPGMPEIFMGTGARPDPMGLHDKALFFKYV